MVSRTGFSTPLLLVSSALTTMACGIFGLELATLSSSTILPFFLRPLFVVEDGALGALALGARPFFGLTLRRDRFGTSGGKFGLVGAEAALPDVDTVRVSLGLSGDASFIARIYASRS